MPESNVLKQGSVMSKHDELPHGSAMSEYDALPQESIVEEYNAFPEGSTMSELDVLQRSVYCGRPNYRIEFTGDGKDCVAVYFTSNNLFFPHNVDMFRLAVLEKDRFEWTRMKVKRAQKHIFLRDVYKQWYASGINSTINTVDALIEWLRKETKGYNELIIIGSSGGGIFLL